MIRANDKTLGTVWIELEPTEYLAVPAVHIMIGDIDYRGRGIGKADFCIFLAWKNEMDCC